MYPKLGRDITTDSRNRPPIIVPEVAAYPGYRMFLITSKVCGFCFIKGVFRKQRPSELTIGTGLLYPLYCLLTLFLYLLSLAGVVMTELGRRSGVTRTAAVIFYGFYVLVYVQAAVNMLVIASKSRTILEILKACSSMESHLGLRTAAVSRRLTKVSHWCLALALLESAKYVASGKKVVPAVLKVMASVHAATRIAAVCFYFVGVFLVGMWFGLIFWMIVYSANVMREYFAEANETLVRALEAPLGCVKTLQRVRMQQSELRRIVAMMNTVVGAPAVLFYGQGVFFMCATSFGIMLSGVSMVDRMLSTYYALSMAIILVVSTRAAHRMTSEVTRGSGDLCLTN